MIGQVSILAATAIVGYDLFADQSWQQSDRPRRINALGLNGSAAGLDTEVELFIGNLKVGNVFNTTTGAVNRDAMFRVGDIIPANTEVHLYVVDAPVTNPINASIDFGS